jgi:hypothetical protein
VPKSVKCAYCRFRLENKETVFTAPSPIIHITVMGDKVYCSTLKDSVFMLQIVQGNAFEYLAGDPQPRFSTYHLATEHELLVVDKTGDLVGLDVNGLSPVIWSDR